MSRLTVDIVAAIENAKNNGNSIHELKRLLTICDLLHKGANEIEGYKQDEIPTDTKYEEAKELLNEIENASIDERKDESVNEDGIESNDINVKLISCNNNNISMIIMDGIQLTNIIPSIKKVILMPKFDGCSIGVELQRNKDRFIVTKAHTRGSDNLTGFRECQNKTKYLSWYSFNAVNDKTIKCYYKDTSIVGNCNKPLSMKLCTKDITKIMLRGELVSNNKNNITIEGNPKTSVGIATSFINNLNCNNEMKQYITFKPFEIAKLYINNNDYIVPTQYSSMEILNIFGILSFPFEIAKAINNNYDMEALLNKFENNIPEPLDGIVYCESLWTYPVVSEESSKHVNYGKYKWKRHNMKQTKLIGLEYSIGKTGKISPTILFETVIINGKKYSKAKSSFSQLNKFEHLYEGMIIDVELKADISPYVANVYNVGNDVENDGVDESAHDDRKEIEIIKNCMYCNNPLHYETNTCSCINDRCIGVNVERCSDLLKQMKIKGLSSKSILKLCSDGNYSFSKIYDKISNKFDDAISIIDSNDFLLSLSIKIKKEKSGICVIDKLKDDEEFVNYLKSLNYFTNDLISFIMEKYL